MSKAWAYDVDGPTLLRHRIRTHTEDCPVVVDMGCGDYRFIRSVWPPARTIGIDIYPNYSNSAPVNTKAIVGDFRDWRRFIDPPERYCAMLIDAIEHISKDDGIKLLRELQIDFERIIVFTPDGFHEQAHDVTGLSNDYQIHLCGWTRDELEDEGFDVETWDAFHGDKGGALFAVWRSDRS